MKRALVVWGGWQGHEPKECTDVFVKWMKTRGFKVVVSDSPEIYENKRRMRHFDVIIPCWTMGEMTGAQSRGLREAVANGCGLAGFHGGMCDAFRKDTEYQFMTGGQFVAHPGGQIDYKVNITEPKNQLVRGIKDFDYKSEQYYMHVDPGNKVLATTTISGKHGTPWIKGTVMPVVWTRMYGKGRVYYSALGHVASEFEQAEPLELMKRGIQWAARIPVRSEYKKA